jgi:uncharacterized membrane protein
MWRNLFFSIGLTVLFVLPSVGLAQELHQELRERVSAEVLQVVDEYEREVTGTGASAQVQEIRAILTSGEIEGEVVRFENDMVVLEPGDNIFLYRMVTIQGQEIITFADFERRPVLVVISIIFVALLLLFAGWHGLRSLISLLLSVAAIIFLLVPALLAGYNPVLASVGIAGAVLALVLFGTHGFSPRVWIAFGGTFSAVVVTGIVAYVASDAMRLTGFGSDASVYLNFATDGELDLAGLLLGGIIIGILGVLDDVSITQASVVQELKAANKDFNFHELYTRASRVGKYHLGSIVNTLALAYVGVSLPLILLYSKTDSSLGLILNQEVVAGELLRIIVGSIGLILAVPATTAVAAWYFQNKQVKEEEDLVHCGHHHH